MDSRILIDIILMEILKFKIRDFYFRALASLVVLSFAQALNFSSVLPSLLSETLTESSNVSCRLVARYAVMWGRCVGPRGAGRKGPRGAGRTRPRLVVRGQEWVLSLSAQIGIFKSAFPPSLSL